MFDLVEEIARVDETEIEKLLKAILQLLMRKRSRRIFALTVTFAVNSVRRSFDFAQDDMTESAAIICSSNSELSSCGVSGVRD